MSYFHVVNHDTGRSLGLHRAADAAEAIAEAKAAAGPGGLAGADPDRIPLSSHTGIGAEPVNCDLPHRLATPDEQRWHRQRMDAGEGYEPGPTLAATYLEHRYTTDDVLLIALSGHAVRLVCDGYGPWAIEACEYGPRGFDVVARYDEVRGFTWHFAPADGEGKPSPAFADPQDAMAACEAHVRAFAEAERGEA